MQKRLAVFYFCSDGLLIAVCAYFGAIHVLNSQVALICSTLIIFASFFGYKNKIKKRALNADISMFDDDDDDESENSGIPQNSSKNSNKNSRIPLRFYDFASLFAPLRLLSYALLVLAFFYLVGYELFRAFSFLAGLSLMPISALFAGIWESRK